MYLNKQQQSSCPSQAVRIGMKNKREKETQWWNLKKIAAWIKYINLSTFFYMHWVVWSVKNSQEKARVSFLHIIGLNNESIFHQKIL